MASGHVNRTNRPNTWPQPTCCTVKKTLANREPSTHGTSATKSTRAEEVGSAEVADVGALIPNRRFDPRWTSRSGGLAVF
jgi:hypothetical protein